MKALNAKEKAQAKGIRERATDLAALATAFSEAERRGESPEYTLMERETTWSDYANDLAKVRAGSPNLKTAQGHMADLGKKRTTAASVIALQTCVLSNLTESRKCRRPTTEFRANDEVALALEWATPPTMATNADNLVIEFGLVGPDGQLVPPPSEKVSDAEGRRPEVRSWWGYFKAGAPGKYEIRVKNRRGDFVWRHRVTVQ